MENNAKGSTLMEQFIGGDDACRLHMFTEVITLLADARLVNDAAGKTIFEQQEIIRQQNSDIVGLKTVISERNLELQQVRSFAYTGAGV